MKDWDLIVFHRALETLICFEPFESVVSFLEGRFLFSFKFKSRHKTATSEKFIYIIHKHILRDKVLQIAINFSGEHLSLSKGFIHITRGKLIFVS